MTESNETVPATSGRTWVALILVAFVAGGVVGATAYGTLTTKPAKEINGVAALPRGGHAAASITPIPVSIITHTDFNRYVATVCPQASIPVKQDGELVTEREMLKCLVVAAQNTREAQPGAATPQHPSLDPQTAAWYRMMAEHGYVPMTIMVPKDEAAGRSRRTP